MLATLVDHPFTREGWLFERKLDGERCLAFRCGDTVRLRSRSDKPLEDTYPELVDALRAQPVDDFVADGEVVAFAGHKTSFARLQQRMQIRDARTARRSSVKVFYYLFDLVYLNGYDITGLPLTQRKALLRRAVEFTDPLRYTPHRVTAGEEAYRQACERGWEGVIAKRAASTYVQSRSREWLKFKCLQVAEFVVGGYTTPAGARAGFGALLVGFHLATGGPAEVGTGGPASPAGAAAHDASMTGAPLVFAGRVGTGFDEATLTRLRALLAPSEIDIPPFTADSLRGEGRARRRAGAELGEVHWVRPQLVVKVGFAEWTPDGRLRQPRYLGLIKGDHAPGG